MAQFVKHFVQDLTQDIKIRQCGTIVFNADNESNVISVDLYNGTEEYSGGGSVAGACICPDGSTVPLTGSISGKTASVVLTGDCFAFPGQIGIGVQVVSGTVKTTVLKAIYNVELFETDDMVDPGSRITASVGQLVADIEAATAEIPASDMASLMSGIAPTFSTSTNYAAGAYVYYSGTLYRFTADHAAGSWTETDATAVALGNDVADLKSAVTNGQLAKNLIPNVYVKNTDGTQAEYNGWSATDFLEVGLLDTLIVNTSVATIYNAFYSTNNASGFIDDFPLVVGENRIIIPSGAKYLRISNTTASMESMTIAGVVGELNEKTKHNESVSDYVIKTDTLTASSTGNKYMFFNVVNGKTYKIKNNSTANVGARTETYNGETVQEIGTISSNTEVMFTASADAQRILLYFSGTGSVTIEDIGTFSYMTNEALANKVNAVPDIIGNNPAFTKVGSSTTINSTDGKTVNVTFAAYGNAVGIKSNGIVTTSGKRFAVWCETTCDESFKVSMLKSGSWLTQTAMQYIPGYGHYGVYDVSDTNDGYVYILYTGSTTPKTIAMTVYVFDVTSNPALEAVVQQQGGYQLIGHEVNAFDKFGFAFGKKIEYFGDSNTANGKYQTFSNSQNGVINSYNTGVGGSNVAGNGDDAFWKDARINTLHDDTDIVYIMGGTNDAENSRTIGDNDITNCDTTTFIGAYNVVLSKIYYKYLKQEAGYYAEDDIDYSGVNQVTTKKDILIVIGTPPFTSDPTYTNSGKMNEIIAAVHTIGKMWGIPVVDVWGESNLNAINYAPYYTDTVHVNVLGGQKIGNIIGKRINEVLK